MWWVQPRGRGLVGKGLGVLTQQQWPITTMTCACCFRTRFPTIFTHITLGVRCRRGMWEPNRTGTWTGSRRAGWWRCWLQGVATWICKTTGQLWRQGENISSFSSNRIDSDKSLSASFLYAFQKWAANLLLLTNLSVQHFCVVYEFNCDPLTSGWRLDCSTRKQRW